MNIQYIYLKLFLLYFHLGIFLGYSILNVLEYLMTVILKICRQKKRDEVKVHEMIKVQEVQRKRPHDISVMKRNLKLLAGKVFSEENIDWCIFDKLFLLQSYLNMTNIVIEKHSKDVTYKYRAEAQNHIITYM